jgi:3-isopropylmalate/(R)-2-methylmalate dehydratase large subunit
MSTPRTLYDKIWDEHVVHSESDGTALLYIDRHLVHEVTSPQAFEGLDLAGRKVWRISANLAVSDHNVPTTDRSHGIADPVSRLQVDTLDANCDRHGITQFKMNDRRQGIVHVIGPEQGATLPGTTVVCGDSHTSTHGAFGALAHGIGTSEVEHVLATQTLLARKAKNMLVRVDGRLGRGCSAKDIVLAVIGKIGTAGGTGHTIEFAWRRDPGPQHGRADDGLQHGDRGGRARRPDRRRRDDDRVSPWPSVQPERRGVGARRAILANAALGPRRTLRHRRHARRERDPAAGHMGDVAGDGGLDRRPRSRPRARARPGAARRDGAALRYMALEPNRPITDIRIDKVFIGSCTNSRIEDLREAAAVVRRLGASVASNVKLAMVVPGSGLVKEQAEREGLDRIFKGAGFEWREAGCSMCLAMNADRLEPGERCASTSNRNFEGRQGAGGRTHLVSPAMAAAAAIEGHFVDVRRLA